MSSTISNNSVVAIHYKLQDDQGNLIDSSEGAEPLTYLQGAGNIIPGLERALDGKAEGDSVNVRIEPGEAYGEVVPELIQTVDRSAFEGVDTIAEGMAFEAQTPTGSIQRIVVKDVQGDTITVDGNHPLAGVPLNFDVDVVSVRDATEEEIAHGHVH